MIPNSLLDIIIEYYGGLFDYKDLNYPVYYAPNSFLALDENNICSFCETDTICQIYVSVVGIAIDKVFSCQNCNKKAEAWSLNVENEQMHCSELIVSRSSGKFSRGKIINLWRYKNNICKQVMVSCSFRYLIYM